MYTVKSEIDGSQTPSECAGLAPYMELATTNPPPEPHVREAGAGRAVLCVHANAGTSGQWRALMDLLAGKFHMLAPDCYDSGKSPTWGSDRVITLRDEVALMAPLFARVPGRVSLVGHSYGAAVALIAALALPARVRALVLYEPTLFSLVDAHRIGPNPADGIRNVVRAAGAALDAGDRERAAELFIDYWMKQGAWQETPEQRKAPIAASVTNVRRWGHALFTEPTPLDAFRALDVPVLYLMGGRSPASAQEVARLLVPALPRVEVVRFDNLGHMGPLTHPDQVNAVIAGFLDKHG